MATIVLFGPGPRFKGGIANYNTSLAKAVDKVLADDPQAQIHIVSWTQQYPAIIPRDFIDRASRHDQLAGTRIQVHYLTNYNDPRTWAATARTIASLQPDKVVFQWAIALQGLPMGWIARRLMRIAPQTEVIFDLHLVNQKEGSVLDQWCLRYGLAQAHTYIVHAKQTMDQLQALYPEMKLVESFDGARANTTTPNPFLRQAQDKLLRRRGKSHEAEATIANDAIVHQEALLAPPFQGGVGGGSPRTVLRLYHPVYDMFQPDPHFDIAAEKTRLRLQQHVFLFFGFIRKYKGLHCALPAFAELAHQRDDVSLLIVGESFWNTLDKKKFSTRLKKLLFGIAKQVLVRKVDDERNYNPLALVDELGIRDRVVLVNRFVPNEEVHRYFQVSDAVLLFYEVATPSGVESIGYNFRMPILATAVGHFPETVQDGFNGYLAKPGNIASMTDTMQRFLAHPIPPEHVAQTASHMSWQRYAEVLLGRAA